MTLTKEELLEILERIEGNPQVVVSVDGESFGIECVEEEHLSIGECLSGWNGHLLVLNCRKL